MMRGVRQAYHTRWPLFVMTVGLTLGLMAIDARGDQAAPPQGLIAVDSSVSMPEFSLPSLNGAMVDSAGLQGKVVVVRFWATW